MEIIVDIGNTAIKVAFFNQAILQEVYRFDKQIDAETTLRLKSLKSTTGIVSSVAQNAQKFIQQFPNIQWEVLNVNTPVPFQNRYHSPKTLGLDRIALAAGAAKNFPNKNVLVIDAGTCITYDFINANAEYLGGAISPGLNMRLQAMHQFTAKLPAVEADFEVPLLAKTTQSCMQSGALHGLVAEIDGNINTYKQRYKDLIIVLTGGDTKKLAQVVKSGIFARQNFLLEGLHAILAYSHL